MHGVCYLGSGHIVRRFDFIERRIRNQAVAEQVVAAFEFRLRFAQVRLGGLLPCASRFIVRHGLAAVGDVKIRLDLQNQVALFDLLALLDWQIDDLTADFRADFDL